MSETLTQRMRRALVEHGDVADDAYHRFVAYCGGRAPPRVPGCDTIIRLALRIDVGRTAEEAAAREYLYRWSLALTSPIFGVPHTIGL
jgi:hypothetical protein